MSSLYTFFPRVMFQAKNDWYGSLTYKLSQAKIDRCPLFPKADQRGYGWDVRFVPNATDAPQQKTLLFDHRVGAADQSIRGNQRIQNVDVDLAVVADRAGMERQEGVLLSITMCDTAHMLWRSKPCSRDSQRLSIC